MTYSQPSWIFENLPTSEAQTFLQWKNIDTCMDFWCPCGFQSHFDGYFAHFVECPGCETVYRLSCTVEVRAVPDDEIPDIRPLRDESEATRQALAEYAGE